MPRNGRAGSYGFLLGDAWRCYDNCRGGVRKRGSSVCLLSTVGKGFKCRWGSRARNWLLSQDSNLKALASGTCGQFSCWFAKVVEALKPRNFNFSVGGRGL